MLSAVNGKCDSGFDVGEGSLRMSCKENVFTFATLVDWGIENESKETIGIVNALHAMKGDLDFIYAGGDNFYDDGVDSVHDGRWQSTWVERFRVQELGLPWVAALGNHDYHKNPMAQVEFHDSGNVGHEYWFMPSRYYKIHVVGTNTNDAVLAVVDSEKVDEDQEEWLEDTLEEYHGVKLVLGHSHIYSAGLRGDTWFSRKKLNKAMLKGGAHAYIAGHEHDLQFLCKDGMDYFIVGGGGGGLRWKV